MNNLKEWAKNMDTAEKRDFLFVYVWTFAKTMGVLACRDKADRVLMEGELTAGIMERLDRGLFKGEGESSFIGWLFLQTSSIVRDVAAQIHIRQVPTVSLHREDGSDFDFKSEDGEIMDAVFALEIVRAVQNVEEDEASELMRLIYVDDCSLVDASKVLGIDRRRAGEIHKEIIDGLTKEVDINDIL
jgi:hypothetical protein